MDKVPDLVLKYLSFTGKCFRHCDKPTSMKVVSQNANALVGAYVCPEGVVSQVVYFSANPDRDWFERSLRDQVGLDNVRDRDIRVASRHGWELGERAEEDFKSALPGTGVIHEIYWTRYPQTEEAKQQVVSLCLGDGAKTGCLRLFVHDRSSAGKRLCASCEAKASR